MRQIHWIGVAALVLLGAAFAVGQGHIYINGQSAGETVITSTSSNLVVQSSDVATDIRDKTTITQANDLLVSIGKGGAQVAAAAQYAQGTLTCTDIPHAATTLVIDNTTFTAIASGAVNPEFNLGATLAATMTNLAAAINANAETARAWATATTVLVEWDVAGTAGNGKTFTTDLTHCTVDGSGTLGGTHSGVAAATLAVVNESGNVGIGPDTSPDYWLDVQGTCHSDGYLSTDSRLLKAQGADVVAANDLTLGNGNYFDVTGATEVQRILGTGWTAGSTLTLQFDAAPLVKNGTAASDGYFGFALNGAADFQAATGYTLTVVFDGAWWREISRKGPSPTLDMVCDSGSTTDQTITAAGLIVSGGGTARQNSSYQTYSTNEYYTVSHDRSDVTYVNAKGGFKLTIPAQKTQGTITCTGLPTAAQTFVVNATTYTARDSGAVQNEFNIGGTVGATLTAMAAMLNAGTDAAAITSWVNQAGDGIVVEADTGGTAPNSWVFTEGLSNCTITGAGTLGGTGATHVGVAADTLADFDQSGLTKLGVGTPGSITTGVYIKNGLEVDATSYFDGGLVSAGNIAITTAALFSAPYFGYIGSNVTDDGLKMYLYNDTGGNRSFVITDYSNLGKDHDHETLQVNPTVFLHSVTDPDTDNTQYAKMLYNDFSISGGGNGGFMGWKSMPPEEVTIPVGSGLDPVVVTVTNMAPIGQIYGATARITNPPGGGATTLDIGITGSGNLDALIDGMSTADTTTATTTVNGDGTQIPIRNAAATTLTLTTDADVTGDDMKVRIQLYYFLLTAPTS